MIEDKACGDEIPINNALSKEADLIWRRAPIAHYSPAELLPKNSLENPVDDLPIPNTLHHANFPQGMANECCRPRYACYKAQDLSFKNKTLQ